jgi:DNA polymerase III alpha subunit
MSKNNFPVVACPTIHYGVPDDRLKFDIIQSIRTRTLLRQDHPEKRKDGKLHFRTPAEMISGCRENIKWLENSLEIARTLQF